MNRRLLFRADQVPVYQNKMFPSREAALGCPTGDLRIVEDLDSGLVFNEAFDPARLQYDESYQNEQANSAVFQRHLDDVLALFSRHFSGLDVIEVGCGKGYFLERMREAGYAASGVDPAYEGEAPYVVKAPFSPDLGMHGEVVVLRHVLEHIPDPVAFLREIAHANGDRGLIYIEVPCVEWILERRAWFDLFYEHVNYFRADDFRRMFGVVRGVERLFGGQYLGVIADLATLRRPRRDEAAAPRLFPEDLMAAPSRLAERGAGAARRVVWGAGAKGMMFAHYLGRHGAPLDFALDISPGKQGGFLAGTGLPVLAPEEGLARMSEGDVIYIMNSNYRDEIVRVGGDRFTYYCVDETT